MKYHEIIQANRELAQKQESAPRYSVSVLANIAVAQLREILEYTLRRQGVNAVVEVGGFDNIIQDSEKVADADLTVVFWEFAYIAGGLYDNSRRLNRSQAESIEESLRSDLSILFRNLRSSSLVLFNKFSVRAFNYQILSTETAEEICLELNRHIGENAPRNLTLVNTEKILADLSVGRCVDARYAYKAKSPYTLPFYNAYAAHIAPAFLAILGKMKKALILDCDNTLWKGTLGEDGLEGIEMSGDTPDGSVFKTAQNLILDLHSQGVVLGLCTKNEARDIREVLSTHPDMQLKMDHIATYRANWSDKASNLIEIAHELNIGLDSIVYVDDSSFEINYITDALPAVTVLQVPENIFRYPQLLRDNLDLFFSPALTEEDRHRGARYKSVSMRRAEEKRHSSIDEYLAALKLKAGIGFDDRRNALRISQLTQRTNQFNLTTRRYTESEICELIDDKFHRVFDFRLCDKFGDYGLTGVAILEIEPGKELAVIDTFLMSCRILGRNVEWVFCSNVVAHAKEMGLTAISAQYIPTEKNAQVQSFYDHLGFAVVRTDEGSTSYRLQLSDFVPKRFDYIEVDE